MESYFENESLVISEEFLFDNRWFHREAGQANSDLQIDQLVNHRLDVLMRTPSLFEALVPRLPKFIHLKRLKIDKITFLILKQLEQVPLEHLEIDVLTITRDCTAKLKEPVRLMLLERLKIQELNEFNEFSRIAFVTPGLNIVSFGKRALKTRPP